VQYWNDEANMDYRIFKSHVKDLELINLFCKHF
jgi:hypothetical protein